MVLVFNLSNSLQPQLVARLNLRRNSQTHQNSRNFSIDVAQIPASSNAYISKLNRNQVSEYLKRPTNKAISHLVRFSHITYNYT